MQRFSEKMFSVSTPGHFEFECEGLRSRTPLLHSFVVSIAVQCSEMASSGLEHRWTKLSVRHPTRPSDQPSTSTNEHPTEQPPISSDGPPTSSNVPPNDQPSTSVNQPQ
ncbi:hypothetical protein V8G54_030557 [Vigna mungo]|uniref:Uncharacterized protein n=1 Tax=Vigna mungo TaxID=3915 RepID=A0AAQ3MWK6_VIGMU